LDGSSSGPNSPNSIEIDEASLLRLYEQYNHQYFDGRLPALKIRLRPVNEDPGLTAEYDQAAGAIVFFSSGIDHLPLVRTMLLHEMVHVAIPEDGHGGRFRAELQRLAEMGAEDAEYEVWRMVGDGAWDDGWIGDEDGWWQRFREEDDS
jgi:hypothetical protein